MIKDKVEYLYQKTTMVYKKNTAYGNFYRTEDKVKKESFNDKLEFNISTRMNVNIFYTSLTLTTTCIRQCMN